MIKFKYYGTSDYFLISLIAKYLIVLFLFITKRMAKKVCSLIFLGSILFLIILISIKPIEVEDALMSIEELTLKYGFTY